MSQRAVFLDRDGVINATQWRDGISRPPSSLEQLCILDGVHEALEMLGTKKFLRIVVTNQPDVARGMQPRHVVDAIHAHLSRALPIDAIFVCYHDDSDVCACRKPKPGMLLEAAAQFDIDLTRSFMVGDRLTDIAAGRAAGCRTLLVGDAVDSATEAADFRVRDLLGAASLIARIAR